MRMRISQSFTGHLALNALDGKNRGHNGQHSAAKVLFNEPFSHLQPGSAA